VRRNSIKDVLRDYRLTVDSLASMLETPRFRAMLEAESARADSLGHRAGYVFRAEDMLSELAERMYQMAMAPDAEPQDVIRAFGAMLQSIGGVESGRQRDGGPVTNIQINIPPLDNPKLRHLGHDVSVQADGD
jgi:hypothetical protein